MSDDNPQEPSETKKAYLRIKRESLLSVHVEAESPEEAMQITERKLLEFTGEATSDIKILATRWREPEIVEDVSLGDDLEKSMPHGRA